MRNTDIEFPEQISSGRTGRDSQMDEVNATRKLGIKNPAGLEACTLGRQRVT